MNINYIANYLNASLITEYKEHITLYKNKSIDKR